MTRSSKSRLKQLWNACCWVLAGSTSCLASADDHFCFDEPARAVYRDLLQLDFDRCDAALERVRKHASGTDTRNYAYLLLENERDFFRLFVYEHKGEFERLKGNRDQRLKRLQRSGLDDRWKQFLQAEIEMHWALIHLKRDKQVRGMQLLLRAHSLIQEGMQRYPDFYPFRKSAGILTALLATIPPEYQWASRLAGLSGDVREGRELLESFIEASTRSDSFLLEEALAAKSFVSCYLENEPQTAYRYWIRVAGLREPGPLFAWVQVKLALRAGWNDAARNALRALPARGFERLPLLHYLQGLAELQALDPSAERHFSLFFDRYPGQTYRAEAWQKRAWHAFLQGDFARYQWCMTNCRETGPGMIDEDKQAYLDASLGIQPDAMLLRARLLSDGGYAERALQLMTSSPPAYSHDDERLTEYHYRLARIYQQLNEPKLALEHFLNVAASGHRNSHLVCNAALQSGILYELTGDKASARSHYEKALQLQPDRYRHSLHQKARAGLSRLRGK
ncbi:MAG: tetratricopeptide repeat protein [Saprospiraceae bacterium]|nr:tetratricopeptide repeat protein [Saprospiraceae bacterium]